jgi:hypothetical protein
MQLIEKDTDDAVINFVVKKLEIMLTSPESVLIEQGSSLEDCDDMFFVAKGECVVVVKDKQSL